MAFQEILEQWQGKEPFTHICMVGSSLFNASLAQRSGPCFVGVFCEALQRIPVYSNDWLERYKYDKGTV
jgi:hypothetical protein